MLCFPVKALHSRAGRGARARHGPGEEKPSLGGSRQGLGPEALRLRRLISVVFWNALGPGSSGFQSGYGPCGFLLKFQGLAIHPLDDTSC